MRLLHITDLHILADENAELYGVDTFLSLKLVLARAFEEDAKPDYIIATGDLSEDATEQSYMRLRRLFLQTGVPVFVIPGNHDSLTCMNTHLIGRLITMDFVAELPVWKVIFLNSQVPGHGYGHISHTQIGALERQLENDRQAPYLIALHHSPSTHCMGEDCQLDNADMLLGVLDKFANARAILSGHAHVRFDEVHSHLKVMTTPATSVQVTHQHRTTSQSDDSDDFLSTHEIDADRHGFRFLDLAANGEMQTMVYYA